MNSKIVYPNVVTPEYTAHDVSTPNLALEFAVQFSVDVDISYHEAEEHILIAFPDFTDPYLKGSEVWAIVGRTSGIVRTIDLVDGEQFEQNWKDTP